MNELKTRIKKQKQNMQNNETTPKYVGYDENKLQENENYRKKANLKS